MVPNINSLRSNFAMRGDFLRNDFANRYGGGKFTPSSQEPAYPATGFSSITGSAQASQMFRNDAGDMIKKVVKTDSKTLNDQIASSLGDEVKDEIQSSPQSYSKPNETVVTQTMKPDQLTDFVSRVQKNESAEQDFSKETTNTATAEDFGMKNVATALRTTEDSTLDQIENPTTSQNFSNAVESIFGKKDDVPKDYKMTKMDITYTKVEPSEDDFDEIDTVDVTGRVQKSEANQNKAKQNRSAAEMTYSDNPWERFKSLYLDFYGYGGGSTLEQSETSSPEDDEFEEIESIDVVGKTGGEEEEDYDEIESIDVVGNVRNMKEEDDDFEEIESVDVVGKLSKTPNVNSTAIPTRSMTSENLYPTATEYDEPSNIIRDTNEILRGKDENASLTDLSNIVDMLKEGQTFEAPPPMIINNNRTITATPMNESKTERVFSDDSTFNRLSFADSNFPQSFAGIF